MSKRALIISGGGAKGAYAVGALDHMVNTLGLKFDLVAGTSTGALISPLALTGDIQELITMYTTVRNSDILKRRELGLEDLRALPISFNETGPVKKLITKIISESRAQALIISGKLMFLTTVNLQTGKIVYFYTGPAGAISPQPDTELVRITSRQMLIDALLASASIPVFMPPVNMQASANSAQQYVDGGLRELTPLKIAMDNGATELYAIILSPKPQVAKNELKSFLAVLAQILDLYGRDVMLNDIHLVELYRDNINYLEALQKRLQARFGLSDNEVHELFAVPDAANPFAGQKPVSMAIIQPETYAELTGDPDSGAVDTLEFNPAKMKKMMEMGKQKAIQVLGPTRHT